MDALADDVLIRVRDLVVGFGEQTVLDHLTLDVRRGEILGVVGASGSGKSVLLRTVIGLVPKRHGSIMIDGAEGRRCRQSGSSSTRVDGAALGHPVPARRAVLLADGAPEYPVPVAGESNVVRAEAGLAFYDRLIDAVITARIEPWLCLYHWDLPQALDDLGGWTNRDTAGWFADYAALIARRFGDRFKRFATFNEPSVFSLLGYCIGGQARLPRGGVWPFRSALMMP